MTKISVDTKTFLRFFGMLLVFIAVGLAVWMARGGLVIIAISVFMAIILNPLVKKIDKLFPGNNRTLATTLSYVVVVGVLLAFLGVAIPAIISESVRFASTLPGLISGIDWHGVNELAAGLGIENAQEMITTGVASMSQDFVKNFGGALFNGIGATGVFIGNVALVLVMTFLMLIEGPSLMSKLWGSISARAEAGQTSLLKRMQREMLTVVSRYVSGQMAVTAINWAATTVSVAIICMAFGLDVGRALPFGMTTAVMTLIPLFGSFLGGMIVAMLLSFISPGAGLTFLIYYLVYVQFEGNILFPRIQGKNMKLPTLVVLIAITIGIYMFGLLGAIVAVPVAGCIHVYLKYYSITGQPRDEYSALASLSSRFDVKDAAVREAVRLAIAAGKFSSSNIQMHMGRSYSWTSGLAVWLEDLGAVGPSEGRRPRDMLVSSMKEFDELAKKTNE
jgi:predicted PurR-regulated permease PerM